MSSADAGGSRAPEQLVRSAVERAGREMKRNNERITIEKLVGRAVCDGDAPDCSTYLFTELAREYVDERTEDDPEGLDVDHHAADGREVCLLPHRRRHRHYQQPRWATTHVENIDRMFVSEPYDADDDEVRIDLDGIGGGMASTHDRGENLNISVWFTREQARELGADLIENADAGVGR
jgi:hypothetical protein